MGCLSIAGLPSNHEAIAGADPGEVKRVNFHPPFSEPPCFFFFSYPQILIGSNTLLQKFTPHFKILDPRLDIIWLPFSDEARELLLFPHNIMRSHEIIEVVGNRLITVYYAILTGRQSGQKLQCLYGNPIANNFFQN